MCGAPWANDWGNVGSVDVFLTYGEYGFRFKESWSYSIYFIYLRFIYCWQYIKTHDLKVRLNCIAVQIIR